MRGVIVGTAIFTALSCTRVNPSFDGSGLDESSGPGPAGSGTSTGPAPTTGPASETTTAGSSSTAALDSTGPVGPASTGPGDADSSTGGDTTGDFTTGDGTTVDGTTVDGTTGTTVEGTTGEALLELGEHALVAAAHCVGTDGVTVTLASGECAQAIAQEESFAAGQGECPDLDPARHGDLGVDFSDPLSSTYVTTHLRFEPALLLPPGTKATGGVLSLTAGCNSQYVKGKQGNVFKPGDLNVGDCTQIPHDDGDELPNMKSFAQGPVEVGGKVPGALEPGERVEWAIDDDELNALLTGGGPLCLALWPQWEVSNNIHYQGNDGPEPPRLRFSVELQ